MRVRAASLTTSSGTLGTVSEPNATGSSNGVFYGVVTGVARPFRQPGVDATVPLPSDSPCCVPLYDGSPERLRVDSDGQPGAAAINLTAGSVIGISSGRSTSASRPTPSCPIRPRRPT